MKQRDRKNLGYEVHGDVIIPSPGDCFTKYSIEGAIEALKKIKREKGINRVLYFEKNSEKKRRKFLRDEWMRKRKA